MNLKKQESPSKEDTPLIEEDDLLKEEILSRVSSNQKEIKLKLLKNTKVLKAIVLIFTTLQFSPFLLISLQVDPIILEIISEINRHVVRTLVVFISAFITVNIARLSKKNISRFRKTSLISLCITMILVYIIVPYLFSFSGFPALMMPFPWSSVMFQLIEYGNWGRHYDFSSIGVPLSLGLYFIIQGIFFTLILLGGRRWFCSMFCTLNGGHAETFGEALPFIKYDKNHPRSKAIHPIIVKVMKFLQITFLILFFGIIIIWTGYFLTGITIVPLPTLVDIETILYLVFGLILLLFLWIVLGGRGYCYYCPAGAFLGILGRISGQQITTGLTKCTNCGSCNYACKMSIDIMSAAIQSIPSKSIDCVGCGLCIDACPHHNLEYSTTFYRKINKRKDKIQNKI